MTGRKVIAIGLLGLLLFNLGGYMLVFKYFIYRSDQFANEQIGKNLYKPADLVEIKIPVQLPDIYNWDTYEPIKGQVQLSNGCYNYVKLRITKDTLYLQCIPNYTKTKLINANIIYAKQISDAPLSKKTNGLLKTTMTTSKYSHQVLQYHFTRFATPVKKSLLHFALLTDHPFIDINGEPPEIIS